MEEQLKYHIGSFITDNKVLRKCRICRDIKELNEANFVRRNTENGWRGACRVCFNKAARVRQEMTHSEREIYKKYRENSKKTRPLEMLLRSCRGNSKKYNNRDFTIINQDLHDLWIKQKGICYYTNRPIRYELGFKDSVSIDRINSKLGYTKDNIVLCQRQVNIMKNDSTVEELLQFAKDILQTYKEKNE